MALHERNPIDDAVANWQAKRRELDASYGSSSSYTMSNATVPVVTYSGANLANLVSTSTITNH